MTTNSSQILAITRTVDVSSPKSAAEEVVRDTPQTRAKAAESMQRSGKKMIFAGFVITIIGVVSYCAVCLAGGVDAELGDILFRNSVPFARATLGILGIGTVVWLVGSFTYLRGTMDAEDDGTDASNSADR